MLWKSYSSETFDELLNEEGRPRDAAKSVTDYIAALGSDELRRRQQAATTRVHPRRHGAGIDDPREPVAARP